MLFALAFRWQAEPVQNANGIKRWQWQLNLGKVSTAKKISKLFGAESKQLLWGQLDIPSGTGLIVRVSQKWKGGKPKNAECKTDHNLRWGRLPKPWNSRARYFHVHPNLSLQSSYPLDKHGRHVQTSISLSDSSVSANKISLRSGGYKSSSRPCRYYLKVRALSGYVWNLGRLKRPKISRQ